MNSLKKVFFKPPVFSAVAAFAMTILVESLSRHDVLGGFKFLALHPQFFFLNFIIIYAAMSLTYFAPKRLFAQFMVLFVFFVLGFVNFVLLFTRTAPFEAVDISILRTGISIVNVYLNTFEIILIAVGIASAIAGIVFLCIKSPKSKVSAVPSAIFSAAAVAVCAAALICYSAFGVIPRSFEDKNDAYDTYGFTYCFARSIFDRGISEPKDYNEYSIDEILESLGSDKSDKPETKANVIMIQLESFLDPSYFNHVKYEKDPVPTFTKLKEEWLSGKLYVPGVGSGTANTEFEVLTGMCLDYFGTGEYPYKTILQSKNCETVCYDLREIGYSAHAFHNHTGTFYNRNTAYKNIGFDTFTPVEYMYGYETNPMGWVKDYVLEDQIIDALDSTDTKDFVFAVTVQGHGKYPTEPVEGEKLIKAEFYKDYSDAFKHQLEYYAYQLWETDDFLARLIDRLSAYDEKCIVIAYGDHQPSLDYTLDDISIGDKHATEYVMWANFELDSKGERHDLEAYQLYSYALSKLGINNGIITKLHQNYNKNDDYQNALEKLEYDMLYGENLSLGESGGYTSPDMRMGIHDITVEGINVIGDDVYVIGSRFTHSSRVKINGSKQDTVYVSDGVLLLEDTHLSDGDVITVHQITNDFVDLGSTKVYVYREVPGYDVPINSSEEED